MQQKNFFRHLDNDPMISMSNRHSTWWSALILQCQIKPQWKKKKKKGGKKKEKRLKPCKCQARKLMSVVIAIRLRRRVIQNPGCHFLRRLMRFHCPSNMGLVFFSFFKIHLGFLFTVRRNMNVGARQTPPSFMRFCFLSSYLIWFNRLQCTIDQY